MPNFGAALPYTKIQFFDQNGKPAAGAWVYTYLAGTLPTPADSICGSALPTLTAGVAAESAVLTGWDTQINQNDVLTFHVNSISSLISATLILRCVRVLGNP